MPYKPTTYTGPTFAGTTAKGGYGVPTSSMYKLILGQTCVDVNLGVPPTNYTCTNHTAWKEFGVFGVNDTANTTVGNAVRENPPASGTCRPAYLAVTILPVIGQTYGERLSLQFMSGGWRSLNVTTPIDPPTPIKPLSKTYT